LIRKSERLIRESGYSKCRTEQPWRRKEILDGAENLTVIAMNSSGCGQQQEEEEGELLHVAASKSSGRNSKPLSSVFSLLTWKMKQKEPSYSSSAFSPRSKLPNSKDAKKRKMPRK
jgi:hypothetical protein